MSSHLRHCPKHHKPLPCAHCALAAKSAAVTIAPPHKADAKPAPRAAITPEIRRRINDSLALAPQNEKAVVIDQVESSSGLKMVSAQEDRVPDVDSIAEDTDKIKPKNTRVLVPPKKAPAKQPTYLKSVAHPVVVSADPNAPFGYDENGRPIRPGRSDQEIAADLLTKPDLAPGDCPHGKASANCLLCGTGSYSNTPLPKSGRVMDGYCKHGFHPDYCFWCERVVTPESDAVVALQGQLGLAASTPGQILQEWEQKRGQSEVFDFFPEILGITRRRLIGLLDLPVGLEKRTETKRILKSTLPIKTRLGEIRQIPKHIEKRKKLIAQSEECIRSLSAHAQKIQVKRGERNPDDILDRATRERYKLEERKRIARCREVIKQLRERQSHLEGLEQRLINWGSRPEDFETVRVATSENVVVTFGDRFELPKRFREDHPNDTIGHYVAVLSEHDLLKDISQRLRNYAALDRWRYLENEIVLQAIGYGLVRPTEQAIKKYPTLDRSGTERPEHDSDDLENRLIIKTGGASIGASIYCAGTTWDGKKRGLSSFDNAVTHGNKDSGAVAVVAGEFYEEIDSGDFGHDE